MVPGDEFLSALFVTISRWEGEFKSSTFGCFPISTTVAFLSPAWIHGVFLMQTRQKCRLVRFIRCLTSRQRSARVRWSCALMTDVNHIQLVWTAQCFLQARGSALFSDAS